MSVTIRCQYREHRNFLVLPVFFLGLVAIAMFALGPQAGSLDDDGDGSPDVPIVVMATGSLTESLAAADDNPPKQSMRLFPVNQERGNGPAARYKVGAADEGPASYLLRIIRC